MTAIDDLPVADIPGWPLIRIELRHDLHTGQPLLTVAGEPLEVPEGEDPHRVAINAATAQARELGRPVRAIAGDGTDDWPLIVYPDGATADPDAEPPRPPRRRARRDRAPRSRLPAGLGFGIAGLVVLIGVATSLMLITPTARSTALPPTTAPSTSNPSTINRPAILPEDLPTSTPSTNTTRTAAPPTTTATPTPTATPPNPPTAGPPEPTIQFTAMATPPAQHAPTATTHLRRPTQRTRRPAPATDPPAPVTITEQAPPTQVTVTAPPAVTATEQPAPLPQITEQPLPQITEQPQSSTPANGYTSPPANTALAPTGSVQLANGYCLADQSSTVRAATCANGDQSQTWTNSEGTIQHDGLCVTLGANSISLEGCTGSGSQIWTRLGTGQLHNQQSGTCLGIAATSDGTALAILDGRCTS
jgi:Ricin-type beta-trefoil lectin domain